MRNIRSPFLMLLLFLNYWKSSYIYSKFIRKDPIYFCLFQAPTVKLTSRFVIRRRKDVQMVDSALKHLGTTSFVFALQVCFRVCYCPDGIYIYCRHCKVENNHTMFAHFNLFRLEGRHMRRKRGWMWKQPLWKWRDVYGYARKLFVRMSNG